MDGQVGLGAGSMACPSSTAGLLKPRCSQDKIDEIADGVPRVSPYRLATHLACAFTIFSLLLHTGLGILQPRALTTSPALQLLHSRMRLLATLVGVTAISGAFVAGMQVGPSPLEPSCFAGHIQGGIIL